MDLRTLSLIGTGSQIGAKLYGGLAAKKEGELDAKASLASGKMTAEQLNRNAETERAAAQRAGFEKQRETDRVISSQVAIAAASGAGASNPTILDLIEDTAGRGKYLKDIEIYGGEERARGLEDQAQVATYNAKVRADAAKRKGKNLYIGSILDSAATGFKGAYYAKGYQ